MKKLKGVVAYIIPFFVMLILLLTSCIAYSTVYAETPNTISINSDPFISDSFNLDPTYPVFRKEPYDVATTDFGVITFKGTDDPLTKSFESLQPTAGRGMVYAGLYARNELYHGLMLSAVDSSYETDIWFVFGTQDRSKKFSFQSFNIGEFLGLPGTIEVIGLRDGVQVGSHTFSFISGTPANQNVVMPSTFNYVDEIRMRQKTEGVYNAGYPGFDGIIVNDFVLGDPVVPAVPTLEFDSASYDAAENEGSATITVIRTESSEGTVTVDYTTTDGTAIAGTDYTAASGTLTFESGATSKTITVPIIDDSICDGNKSLDIVLSSPSEGVVLGSQSTATLTIVDNEHTLSYSAGAGGSITGATSQLVSYGSNGSEVTAIADPGYHFIGWSDGVTTASRTDINVEGDINVTAGFAINEYTLSYTAGAGGSISGANLQTVEHGSNGAAVTATPAAGYHFVNWSDGVATASRADDNVTEDISVTANFTADEYTLSYTAGANGSITGTTPQTVIYGESGTTVTAIPAAGYHFVGWSDGVTTASRTDINVAGDINVTASFAINEYTLSYVAGAGGSITGITPQIAAHGSNGAAVTAVPAAGYHFVSWSDGLVTASRTDNNVTEHINVTASFEINEYALNYFAGANGTITGVASQTVGYGGNGTVVTAVAAAGYHFVGWSDGVTTASRTDINVAGDINVIASFAINEYTLSYIAGANGSITGTASQIVAHGSNGAAVTAVPAAGYHFVSWSDGVATPSRTDNNVTEDINVTASFEINEYALNYFAGANGIITGTTVQTVEHGSNGTGVTAVPAAGYHFINWSDGVATANRTDLNVIGNISVTANFAINTYTLSYTAGAGGSIAGTASQTVEHGSNGAAVTAVATAGYHFIGWSDGVTTASRTDSNITGNISITANFEINEYTLNYSAGANGSITGTASQTVSHGGSGTVVTAVPAEGYHFIGWSDGVTTANRTDINVSGDINVTASFAINEYTLSYVAGAGGSITGTASQLVAHGSNGAVVTAVPAAGYHFVNWSDGVATPSRTDNNVTGNISVTASFAANTYNVSFESNGGSLVSAQTVDYNGEVIRPENPTKPGYIFAGWYKEPGLTSQWSFTDDRVPAGDITLYAKWGRDSGDGSDDSGSTEEEHKKPTEKPTGETYEDSIVKVNGQEEKAGKEVVTGEASERIVKVEVISEVINKKIEEAATNQSQETNGEKIVEIQPKTQDAKEVTTILTGEIVKVMNDNEAILKIKTNGIDYVVPIKEIGIEGVAQKLGITPDKLKEIEVEVKIEKADEELAKRIEKSAELKGYEVIFPPVSFEIVAKTRTKDGEEKEVKVHKFNQYVQRVMKIPEGIEPSKITTGVVYNEDGTLSHVPTEVFKIDGVYYARLNSLTNSSYSVIWNPIGVSSVESHWSKEYVNDMASRLVIKNSEAFTPDREITRGEFAEYITKALGIYRTGVAKTIKFTDVDVTDELADAIEAAAAYGIISGYPDGSFRPDVQISREEAMTMYASAMNIVRLKEIDSNKIKNYKDVEQIAPWAYDSVKKTIGAGVFNGRTNEIIDPKGTFTYAEAATAIRNLLVASGLINE